MSLVSREHFARRAAVLVKLSVIPGKPRSLPARVIYSRSVREGWYLTGVQFGPIEDARLRPQTYEQISAVQAPSVGQLSEDDDDEQARRDDGFSRCCQWPLSPASDTKKRDFEGRDGLHVLRSHCPAGGNSGPAEHRGPGGDVSA